MKLEDIKLEFYFLRRVMLKHGKGLSYLRAKYITAPQLRSCGPQWSDKITNTNLSIHILIGHKHVTMTLWSIGSFFTVSKVIGELFIHTDGTLTESDYIVLKFFFPGVKFVKQDDYHKALLNKWSKNPVIMNFRRNFASNFYLTKLIDPLLLSDKQFHLILDPDILWFNDPTEIAEAISKGCSESLMMAGNMIHGEVTNTVFLRNGKHLPSKYSKYNGGIILHNRDNLSPESLEIYFKNIDMTHPLSKHFVEQSGYAYNLQYLSTFPKERYTIKGNVDDNTVAKHYTGPRREFFYIDGLLRVKNKLWQNL